MYQVAPVKNVSFVCRQQIDELITGRQVRVCLRRQLAFHSPRTECALIEIKYFFTWLIEIEKRSVLLRQRGKQAAGERRAIVTVAIFREQTVKRGTMPVEKQRVACLLRSLQAYCLFSVDTRMRWVMIDLRAK